MSADLKNPDFARRKALRVAAGALCSENGFTHIEDDALETLTEMLQSYISEMGRAAHGYTELSGRTEPMISDVVMALIEMGCNIEGIQAHAKRPNKTMFMPPLPVNQPVQPKTLHTGEKKSHPPHIPDYLPPFPDSHTYIRTLTYKPPPTEYQLIREKAASQKRDIEVALTKFIAKTGETESLFADDPYAYPLIANKSKALPYLDALLPKEEDLDNQDPEEPSAAQKQLNKQNAKAKEAAEKEQKEEAAKAEAAAAAAKDGGTAAAPATPAAGTAEQEQAAAAAAKTEEQQKDEKKDEGEDNQIDNPYLRPIKMPKLKFGKKVSHKTW